MLNKKVIVVGDACIDVHIKLSDYLNEDSSKQMPYKACLGGTIANTALSLKKLGIEVAFLGTVGNDYAGKQIIQKLNEYEIDTNLTIIEDGLNTINVFALIDDSGERHLWGYPREDLAYACLNLNHVNLDLIKDAAWLHSSGMALLSDGSIQDSIVEIFRIAKENNIPTSFDFNTRVSDISLLNPKAVKAINSLLPYVDYLTGSYEEFKCFYPSDDVIDSVKYFASQNKTCIARNGKEGYLCISNDRIIRGKAFDIDVIDSTGAGDYFNAGLIAGMLEGKNIEEACELANCVAAYKISTEDLIDRNKVEDFVRRKNEKSNS